MTCQHARDLFSARADEALSAAEQAELQAHLATCADCQREWARFEQTVAFLRAIEPAHAPAGFVDRVVAARPRPWYTRLARGLFVPWPVKLPLEAAAILLVAGLAIMIVQRSPELQQASRLDEARPAVPTPTSLEQQAPAGSTTTRARQSPATAPAPSSKEQFSGYVPDTASSSKAEPALGARQDAREVEGVLRARDRAQNFGEPAKKMDAAPDVRRKEPERKEAERPGELLSGGKVGGVAQAPPPPAPASTPPAPATAPSAPTAPTPPSAPSVSAAESMAKQATPERRAAASGLAPAAAGLQARLTVADRAAAEATVRDLVTRVTGRVVSQSAPAQADASASTIVLLVPAERWDELRRGLEALGTLRVTGQKTEDADQLLITLRLGR